MLPELVEKLCRDKLVIVRDDPDHNLAVADRLELYRSFGPSRLDLEPVTMLHPLPMLPEQEKHANKKLLQHWAHRQFADFVIGELAILTTEHVYDTVFTSALPDDINEFELVMITDAKEMLELAPQILRNEVDILTGKESLSGKFWYFSFKGAAYNLSRLYCAAAFCLKTIIYGSATAERPLNSAGYKAITLDFAQEAALAFSALPDPVVRDWEEAESAPVAFDPRKRLEFWEWWLTCAIPRAWEMAGPCRTNRPTPSQI